jgi:competence protein ComEC
MRKYLIFSIISIIFLAGFVMYQYIIFYDNKLHIVFCDVGQGDAIFIRTPERKNILVDGGPDNEVLSCLADNLPFWDKRLDMIVLSHPHLDHFMGLYFVIDRYYVTSFVTEKLSNNIQSFRELEKKVMVKKIAQKNVFAGDRFKIEEDLVLKIVSPSDSFLKRTSPNGLIGESGEFASLILKLSYKDFDLLLTGDAQSDGVLESAEAGDGSVEVLQVPHHGSATGLNKEIVEKLSPKLAVISVGARNRYGHPNKKILEILDEARAKVLRTDEEGDVEIVSDGKVFWVEK